MTSARSFRLVCDPGAVPAVEALLHEEGFSFDPEPFYSMARRLAAFAFPLGSSLAARFGLIYIQDRSSMLPALALAPGQGEAALDMCASPGSKTGQIGQMVGQTGFVLGNEPSRNRLATLRRNLQALNLLCCATMSCPGERLPLPAQSWDRVLLDPPCSGWGTADKHPSVMTLWQGEKVNPLITLQRKLLKEAARLLRPGGRLVYSTCTTNIRENEDQLAHAVDELGLEFQPVSPPPGFAFADAASPRFAGALRVENGPDGQGFFVGLLSKGRAGPEEPASAPRPEAAPDRARSEPLSGAFFVRPWERESRFVGERRRHGRTGPRGPSEPELLPRAVLEESFADAGLLPPGRIALFNGQAYFLPEASAALVPPGLAWKAFPLGKPAGNGGLRLGSRLRCLMPSLEDAEKRGLDVLNLEERGPLQDLCAGRSIAVRARGPEMGVYYRGLALCRLRVQGNRAVLPL